MQFVKSKSCQKFILLAILTSFSVPVMAEDYNGLLTGLIGFPTALLGSVIVGLIYGLHQLKPSKNKKLIGSLIGSGFLLFDGWIIILDTFDFLKERFLDNYFDMFFFLSIIEITAYFALMHFTYKFLINKKLIN